MYFLPMSLLVTPDVSNLPFFRLNISFRWFSLVTPILGNLYITCLRANDPCLSMDPKIGVRLDASIGLGVVRLDTEAV